LPSTHPALRAPIALALGVVVALGLACGGGSSAVSGAASTAPIVRPGSVAKTSRVVVIVMEN
jgi:hypothetical protein